MFNKIFIANRGEIALRIARAARDLGLETALLQGETPAAFLDIPAVIAAALAHGCTALHPGYGFLSERADFASACAAAGIKFIGPTPAQLQVFGDKAQARLLARQCGVPVLPGAQAASLAQAQAFFSEHTAGGVMVKAVHGGGGRGMRAVVSADVLEAALARAASEANAAFGNDTLYLERLYPAARHIEVQIAGDGAHCIALGTRDCTVQRRFQKLIEIAPAWTISTQMLRRLRDAALALAHHVHYEGVGTFEFLVNESDVVLPFVFIEANPRLQVEHTITEEVFSIDLVQLQIRLAQGETLAEMNLHRAREARGMALQLRINAETLDDEGNAWGAVGTLTRFDLPGGRGVRIDTHAHVGEVVSGQFDSLLAKLIVTQPGDDFAALVQRAQSALSELRIDGVATNAGLLAELLKLLPTASLHTRWLEEALPDLLSGLPATRTNTSAALQSEGHENAIVAPMAATVIEINVAAGTAVRRGQALAVLEAMKMQHVISAPASGVVVRVNTTVGAVIGASEPLLHLEPAATDDGIAAPTAALDPEWIRPDLQRVRERHALGSDTNRTDAVARRHAAQKRTARENLADLCQLQHADSSFSEYGALAIAAQARRRSLDDLMQNTPADGMVTGIGTVNAALFGPKSSKCVVMLYDYTVLAGTQGWRNHHKKDRMLGLAHRLKLPVVLYAEGGGGRPGDVDMPIVAGLNNHTFSQFAALSGKVPVIGVVAGYCFAGNAALLGVCDVIIATEDCNIGMGGPAMIEGGGLGQVKPTAIGPSGVQSRNGVIDILVRDEAEATRAAQQYLSYFQGRTPDWRLSDQRALRHVIPENRLRAYDMRAAAPGMFDTDSMLELRAEFGHGVLTWLARIEGRPVGVLANNPLHLGGAIDADAADKAARFMQLCDAHGLPLVALVDTPGFMVGPAVEEAAQVRHVSRMFVVEAQLTVPFFAVVLRKGYGLGAQAMTAGGFDAPVFTIAWPTGEFGGMGLEGAVRLGYRKELEAAADDTARQALYEKLVAKQYENGHALNMATTLEIDAVIDPAETRAWLVRGLESVAVGLKGSGRFVDTW